jgi:urease accessory protein
VTFRRSALLLAWLTIPRLALAHSAAGSVSGFGAGFLHPISGVDHVLAMLAVGMWGAELGGSAMWTLPVAFPVVMSLGGVAGILGLPMIAIEPGIAASVIVLGAVIAANFRPHPVVATILVGVFAIFHGYAHGAELPHQVSPLDFCVGFVVATGLLHLTGIAIGAVTKLPHGLQLLRMGGALVAGGGVFLAHRLLPH